MSRSLPLLLLCSLLGACADHTPSDLFGSADLQLVGAGSEPERIVAENAPDKFRAQVNDDGERCELGLELEFQRPGRDTHLRVNTFPDQVAPLFAGAASVTLPSTTNRDRSVVLNYATVYWERTDGNAWYSRAGSVRIGALPEPRGMVRVDFENVELESTGVDESATLNGNIQLTFLGAVVTGDAGRACPSVTRYPGGFVN